MDVCIGCNSATAVVSFGQTCEHLFCSVCMQKYLKFRQQGHTAALEFHCPVCQTTESQSLQKTNPADRAQQKRNEDTQRHRPRDIPAAPMGRVTPMAPDVASVDMESQDQPHHPVSKARPHDDGKRKAR